jgi:hypothetical protein
VYREAGLELALFPSGLTRLEMLPGETVAVEGEELSEQELRRAVDDFLLSSNLRPEQAEYDYIESKADGSKVVHYYQGPNGLQIYAGYLRVYLELAQIVMVEIYWLNTEQWPREREMEVITVKEALLRLIGELGLSAQPRQIISADFGFFSRTYDAEKWEVPPVWRFIFADGAVYYINGFTGNLELDL